MKCQHGQACDWTLNSKFDATLTWGLLNIQYIYIFVCMCEGPKESPEVDRYNGQQLLLNDSGGCYRGMSVMWA